MEPDKTLTLALAAEIDDMFSEWQRDDSPGCAIAVYKNGSIAYARGYGMANLEHAIPITIGSIFHVASLSKQFTAHCLALLENDAKLSFDDDIRDYFPEIPDYGLTITIRQLMHHTSGLRDQWELLRLSGWRPDDVITDDDVLDICRKQTELNFAPGSRYLYSNTGYTLMGLIVKRITGQSLREFAHERIFEPLGMTRSHFHDDHNEIVPGRTHGYEPLEDDVHEGGWRISNPIFDTTGATSLHTTIEDLLRWNKYLAAWLADPENERLASRATLTDGEETSYACGLGYGEIGGLETVGHSGSDAGYRAHYMRVPERDTAVAILCNASTMSPGELAERVLAAVLDLDLDEAGIEDGGDISLTDDQLARWSGVYCGLKTGMYQEVILEDGELQLPILFDMKLVPLAEDRFQTVGPRRLKVSFEANACKPAQMIVETLDTFVFIGNAAPSNANLDDYAGSYESAELATSYQFEVEDGELIWKRRRFEGKPLRHLVNDTFASGSTVFEFDRKSSAKVTGFSVHTMRAYGMRFKRA